MLKITKRVSDTVTIEGGGETAKEAMLELGPIMEGYRRLEELGEDPALYTPVGRVNKGFTFFSLSKDDGTKELKFGITKEGEHLFPKSELEEPWTPNAGGGGGGGGGDW
jgi:hypothetical protein